MEKNIKKKNTMLHIETRKKSKKGSDISKETNVCMPPKKPYDAELADLARLAIEKKHHAGKSFAAGDVYHHKLHAAIIWYTLPGWPKSTTFCVYGINQWAKGQHKGKRTFHAEENAKNKLPRDAQKKKCIVIRLEREASGLSKLGFPGRKYWQLLNSKPCENCQAMLNEENIKVIGYSEDVVTRDGNEFTMYYDPIDHIIRYLPVQSSMQDDNEKSPFVEDDDDGYVYRSQEERQKQIDDEKRNAARNRRAATRREQEQKIAALEEQLREEREKLAELSFDSSSSSSSDFDSEDVDEWRETANGGRYRVEPFRPLLVYRNDDEWEESELFPVVSSLRCNIIPTEIEGTYRIESSSSSFEDDGKQPYYTKKNK